MAHSRHRPKPGGAARNCQADLTGCDPATGGFNRRDPVAFASDAGDFTVLDDVDAQLIRGPGIAPDHRIMAGGSGAFVHCGPHDRETRRGIIIQMRHCFFEPLQTPDFCIGIAGAPHDIVVARRRIHRAGAMEQGDMRALAEHHVVVQLMAQLLPELQRMLIEFAVARLGVIGAHDGGVTPGVATRQSNPFPGPRYCEHRGSWPDSKQWRARADHRRRSPHRNAVLVRGRATDVSSPFGRTSPAKRHSMRKI